MYILGIGLISGSLNGLQTNPVNGIILWSTAIDLFLSGHKIEGNLRAMTPIVIFKYIILRSTN